MHIDWPILLPLMVAIIGLSASIAGVITARSLSKKTAINGLRSIIDAQAERIDDLRDENKELRAELDVLRKGDGQDRR